MRIQVGREGSTIERRELLTVAAVILALAVVSTFPLVRRISPALPGNRGDPLLNAFILDWDAGRTRHGFRALWDAPFYFPNRDTLSLSEHLPASPSSRLRSSG